MSVIVSIVIVIIMVSMVFSSIAKNVARAKGQQKCAFCGAHLKKATKTFGYASHCARCGREQPWAVKA